MKPYLIFCCGFLVCCTSENESNTPSHDVDTTGVITTTNSNPVDTSRQTSVQPNAVFTSEVFETKGLGWGYKIFDNGVLFINQPHIPAIQGNKGFSSREKAQVTANFAILKMKQGITPPTISPEELDSLGVLD